MFLTKSAVIHAHSTLEDCMPDTACACRWVCINTAAGHDACPPTSWNHGPSKRMPQMTKRLGGPALTILLLQGGPYFVQVTGGMLQTCCLFVG